MSYICGEHSRNPACRNNTVVLSLLFSISKNNLDDLKQNQRSIPLLTQKWMLVPFPAVCWFNMFPYLSVMLLSPGPIWHHWEAYTVWPGAGGEVREVCEGENGDWAELCQTIEVGLAFFSLFSYAACLKMLCQCACVCLPVCAWAHVKRLFMKYLCGLMTTLGQNLTCLWNTGLILQLQCAQSSPLSLHIHGAPSSSCLPVCRPPSGAALCWGGEEVGADWHMIERMWSEGEWKKEEQLF